MHTPTDPAAISVEATGTLPDVLPYPLTDNQRLVEILADILDKPLCEIRKTLYEVERSPTGYFRKEFAKTGIEPYVWSDQLETYYKQTDIYLYGGIVWNRNPYKVELRTWIANYLRQHRPGRQQILTVGDGVGFDSLYLSQCGHDVTYSELSEKCLHFARTVFDLANEPVNVVDDLSNLEQAGYDVVLCLDVLEHVPEPHELVEQFSRYLRPSGLLIVHAPFYYVSPENPTHLNSNRKHCGHIRNFYGRYDFSLQDGRLFWDPLVLVKASQKTPTALGGRMWRVALRAVGMLLAVGRVWCAPHNWFASQLAGKGESHWLAGLEDEELPTGEKGSA